jgi:hypothetical protein
MTLLVSHRLDLKAARQELSTLEGFLKANNVFAEREIVSLLKLSPNLTIVAGALGRGMVLADAFKYEFRIQGVVAADLVLRSRTGKLVFVEFEGGTSASIFARRSTNQLREWSREIEHATGQIVDWSWVLSEATNSTLLAENLGVSALDVQYIVVCGRDSELDSELLRRRFVFRHSKLNVAGNSVVFLTYDGFFEEVSHALTELWAEGANPRSALA